MKILKILALAALLLPSCTADEEYSSYPCRLVFDQDTHAISAAMQSALNALSPGVFCKVSQTQHGGQTYYLFSTNQGLEDEVVWTGVDQRTSIVIGMNNGLVFGYGNLDTPATLYAYDAECPNCFDSEALPLRSHPLKLQSTGRAKCSTCQREYDMNTGGNVVIGNQGKGLTRYRAAYNGHVLSIV